MKQRKKDDKLDPKVKFMKYETDKSYKTLVDFFRRGKNNEKHSNHPVIDIMETKSGKASYGLQRMFTYINVILNFMTVIFEFSFLADVLS